MSADLGVLRMQVSAAKSVVHVSSGRKWDGGELGGHPMPGAQARGRTIPNQAGLQSPGVRNEHVPPAEAKMCSELHGNMQRPAEMTGPDDVSHNGSLHHQVTACNTDYVFYRPHSDRV